MIGMQIQAGQRFGRLTVVEEAPRRKGERWWRCRCDCGREVETEESHLKNGHTKSCGCYRREAPKSKRRDLRGRSYGRLFVLEEDPQRPGFWRCQCSCGRIVSCYKENLTSGSTRSCGCLQDENRRENFARSIHFVEGTNVERIASSACSR